MQKSSKLELFYILPDSQDPRILEICKKVNIVLLAGTNDFSRRKTQPINLMDNLIESLDELKKFTNVKSIFVCKLPPRSDISRVNQKVHEFNQLLLDKFSNSDFVSVIDTVPPERRLFYKDGIHLSDFGLVKVCGILLSNLYDRIAPNLKRKNHKTSENIQSVKSHT